MRLKQPYCFPAAYPYSELKPLAFHLAVITANWKYFHHVFGLKNDQVNSTTAAASGKHPQTAKMGADGPR